MNLLMLSLNPEASRMGTKLAKTGEGFMTAFEGFTQKFTVYLTDANDLQSFFMRQLIRNRGEYTLPVHSVAFIVAGLGLQCIVKFTS